MHRTVVLNVVGLSRELLDDRASSLSALARRGGVRTLEPVLPAVTCPAQATFMTGRTPSGHGCVANGWYYRDTAEVALWKQSAHLVEGEKVWEAARRREPSFTFAQLFWWFNMYSGADWSVTPRPIYRADGLKIPDIYTSPPSLRDTLVERLGAFPLFEFWGPRAGISASRWIARAALEVDRRHEPTLTFVYLPHLDYDLQRFGPRGAAASRAVREIDEVCGELLEHYERAGVRVIVLSEYGIAPVSDATHINRALREVGLLAVREEGREEKLDAGASEAFAVADHQVAHVYVQRGERLADVRHLLEELPGVEAVLDDDGKARAGLDHPRAGDLVAVARPDRWFSYYYWLDDERAPDFARTVDIHRKPGYDPVELFLDPALRLPKLKVAWTLLKKQLGFRTLLDVIPLDASLVRGSHGRLPDEDAQRPVFLTTEPELLSGERVHATEVKDLVLRHVFDEAGELGAAAERRVRRRGGGRADSDPVDGVSDGDAVPGV